MNLSDAREIVSHITHPGFTFNVGHSGFDDVLYLSVNFETMCSRQRVPVVVSSGKRHLHKGMSETELVTMAYELCKSVLLHELGEWFTYRTKRPFNPHTSIRERCRISSTEDPGDYTDEH